MKNKILITEDNLVKIISKIVNETKESELLREQYQFLTKYFGSVANFLIKKFDDNVIQKIESAVAKGLSNRTNYKLVNGDIIFLSKRGTEVSLKEMKEALKSVEDGRRTMDDVLNSFPRQLADGTEFRSLFALLKPKPQVGAALSSTSKLPLTQLGIDFKNFHSQSKWVQVTQPKGNMSGWKFHVYADNLDEVAYLYERLLPLVNKYGAGLKLAGGKELEKLSQIPLQKGKGVTIYLRSKTFADDMVDNFVSDLQSAISGYTKKGNINGDRMITNNIGYRYELSRPINSKIGVDENQYYSLYSSNQGGPHNIPNNPDLFR
jgi:hypothetical protein